MPTFIALSHRSQRVLWSEGRVPSGLNSQLNSKILLAMTSYEQTS
jgi:hypothetical protein